MKCSKKHQVQTGENILGAMKPLKNVLSQRISITIMFLILTESTTNSFIWPDSNYKSPNIATKDHALLCT